MCTRITTMSECEKDKCIQCLCLHLFSVSVCASPSGPLHPCLSLLVHGSLLFLSSFPSSSSPSFSFFRFLSSSFFFFSLSLLFSLARPHITRCQIHPSRSLLPPPSTFCHLHLSHTAEHFYAFRISSRVKPGAIGCSLCKDNADARNPERMQSA